MKKTRSNKSRDTVPLNEQYNDSFYSLLEKFLAFCDSGLGGQVDTGTKVA